MIRRAAAACILSLGLPCLAAEPRPLTASEKETLNFAFAGRLGSGVYTISDRTVQIYRVPFGYKLRSEEEHAVGLQLTLQTTFGFYDFRTSDIADTGLPDDVDTFGVQPGIELRFLPTPRWLLRPYVEAGYSDDRAGNTSAWLYTAGVRSLLTHDFEATLFRLSFGNDAFLARADPSDLPPDDYAMLQTSLELRRPLGPTFLGRPVDAGLYLFQDLTFDAPHFPIEGDRTGSDDQYEAGITIGTEPQAKWWWVPIPRLGVGYRFAGDLSAWRFVIGIPATSLGR